MLAGKGFENVYNLSGGIKAWKGKQAIGDETLGLDLFSGSEAVADTLKTAYGLEAGLREFYLSMAPKVSHERSRQLFDTLSEIELKHQKRIFDAYLQATGETIDEEAFGRLVAATAVEGGLTTDEYIGLYQPDLEIPGEVISLAMAIEAQAMDMYQRAAEHALNEPSRVVLMQIADEERSHLNQLGALFETL